LSKEKVIPMEEKKARVLIKLRNYKILKKKEFKNTYGFVVKTPQGKSLVYCIPVEGTVGVAYINQLAKTLEEEKLERAIVVIVGKYTQAARKKALVHGIELIPKIFPSFNLFDHEMVPKHEILPPDEREALLEKYRVKPYQLPNIKTSDPAVIAIGAKAGDVVKITRNSQTSGEYNAYRYVVLG
jgi:DNA-directed RNA polymerase subunit H (RpoH/RPB5)